ncbi:MAG: glycosyltransferase family 4 protein [Dehalococcoidia bacterium]
MAEDSSNSHPLLRNTFRKTEFLNLSRASQIWSNGFDTSSYLNKLGFHATLMKNGVDCYEFNKPEDQYSCPDFLDKNLTNITMVATLRTTRGIDTSIKACSYLSQITKNFHMVFVGKGSKTRWEKLAKEMNVDEHIRFAGERTDIADILHFSDIVLAFCNEQYASGLSMSLLEAMASRKAIVAWDNAIYNQLLSDHNNALLVPEKNSTALAHAVLELINNPNLRRRIGSNARKTVADYDWAVVVADFRKFIAS